MLPYDNSKEYLVKKHILHAASKKNNQKYTTPL